ncbi:MAG: hypothetical protein LUD77_05205 [Clostridiales bacterium]|nr:hypothetical protein [Clostridiales bacterium]
MNSETFKIFIRKYENKLNTYNSYLDYEDHPGVWNEISLSEEIRQFSAA